MALEVIEQESRALALQPVRLHARLFDVPRPVGGVVLLAIGRAAGAAVGVPPRAPAPELGERLRHPAAATDRDSTMVVHRTYVRIGVGRNGRSMWTPLLRRNVSLLLHQRRRRPPPEP